MPKLNITFPSFKFVTFNVDTGNSGEKIECKIQEILPTSVVKDRCNSPVTFQLVHILNRLELAKEKFIKFEQKTSNSRVKYGHKVWAYAFEKRDVDRQKVYTVYARSENVEKIILIMSSKRSFTRVPIERRANTQACRYRHARATF